MALGDTKHWLYGLPVDGLSGNLADKYWINGLPVASLDSAGQTTTQTQVGKAAIQKTVSKTQVGVARISLHTEKSQVGVARIQVTNTKNQSGKANISKTTTRTQVGVANIKVVTSKTQVGKASIQATTDRTQIGKARIQLTSTKTQAGKAFIILQSVKNQVGKARIYGTTRQDQLGQAAIQNTTLKTQAGKSRVQITDTKNQAGKASIVNRTAKKQVGRANIKATTAKIQVGKARIHALTPTYAWRVTSDKLDSSKFANRVIMLGFIDTNGVELRSQVDNILSQDAIGRIVEAVVVDRTITDQSFLDLRAAYELLIRKPLRSIQFDFDKDGLEVGEVVQINSDNANIHGEFQVQTLSMRLSTPTRTVYTATVGDYIPPFTARMKSLTTATTAPKPIPVPTPTPPLNAWQPFQDQPNTSSYRPHTEWTFSLKSEYQYSGDTVSGVDILVTGAPPQNKLNNIAQITNKLDTTTPLVGITTASGGAIAGGQTIYMTVCASLADTSLNAPSATTSIVIPAGSDTNTVALDMTDVVWPPDAYGWSLFAGTDSRHMTFQKSGGVSTSFNIVADGDSLTVGYPVSASGPTSYPGQLATLIGIPVANLGEDGASSSTLLASHISEADGLFDGSKENIYILGIGRNDLAGSNTLADLKTNVASIVSGRQGTGFKVVVLTVAPSDLPGQPAGFEADRLAYNAWVVAGHSGADYVCDSGSDPRIADTNDATKYQVDRVHMTEAGYAVLADDVRNTLAAEVATGAPTTSDLTLTALNVAEYAVPDTTFDHLRLKVKLGYRVGCLFGNPVVDVTGNNVTLGEGGEPGNIRNDYSGLRLQLFSRGDLSEIPVRDYAIVKNIGPVFQCADTPDIAVGDTAGVLLPAAISSATTIGHPLIGVNEISGFDDTFIGKQVRIVDGKGKGQTNLITAVTINTLTLANGWTIIPDETSYWIVEEPSWMPDTDGTPLSVSNPFGSVSLSIPATSLTSNAIIILAETVAADGTISPENESPVRVMWLDAAHSASDNPFANANGTEFIFGQGSTGGYADIAVGNITNAPYAKLGGTFVGWTINSIVAPVGADIIVDIFHIPAGSNIGTSLFTDTLPTLTDGTNESIGFKFGNIQTINAGDRLYAVITQVGSDTPGQGLTLQAYWE